MIRISIVEDEQEYADQLQEYLHQYERDYKESFEITVYRDGDALVTEYRSQFDIILMDIQMGFLDGMSAAEEIRKRDKEVVIIFVTNMAGYAIRGYEVDALDYVLKPVSYFAFSQRLLRAIERMKKRETKYIQVNIRGGTLRLEIPSILYVESRSHNMIFHTTHGSYEAVGVLRELEKELLPSNFFRGNKGYLINLAHVDGVRDSFAIIRGKEVLLSRARKREFMEALARYWGEAVK